ncbi:alpha/beta hydrolase [Agriterribacter sp.]|uniref:alpha/beta hydrolase n=1 Tax=Agriterribacter sp. TaxID=2821509 RepID=UPI002CD85AB0|nr:alpha/beta hydrolase [Agriterribacter sp.]HTN06977.1 alpha/beta hydrolase [Agriterribacter sp.]
MLRLFIPGCILTCITLPLYGQQLPGTRYKDLVFTAVTVNKNIMYQPNPPAGVKEKYYLFDLYQPGNDTSTSRPLILWIHGGGFKFGNKSSRGTPLWCRRFAERGYVCAAVNYRLSKKNTLSDFNALVNACSDAIEDINEAVSFFEKNHALYKIDTSRIILAGNSAGGMMALQSVYSNTSLMKQTNQPAVSPAPPAFNPGHIAAVVNFWGGMFDTSWLKNASVPIVSVHGSKDRIVPADKPGKGIYGSFIIHRRADTLHIPNRLKVYEGYAHELQKHFNPLWTNKATKVRWQGAGQFAADFLYEALFK